MSRSGYSDDGDYAPLWRGQVASAIRGKRGQAFLRELVAALDAMPEKRLIKNELLKDGEVCALGAVGVARGIALEELDPEDPERLGKVFGIAHQLAAEIEWYNDDYAYSDTPEKRWQTMRDWAASKIKPDPTP